MTEDGGRGRILVTGATGYIGGRIVPRLLDAGRQVRCITRDPARLDGVPWRAAVEVARADLLEPESLDGAFEDIDAAFYLVHSMEEPGADFADRDRRAARDFAEAASRSKLRRMVYLGGLGRGDLSAHLSSRQEVGRVLASTDVPVTELRAAVIVGAGSVSFEMLRYLTDVLPAMVTPRWVGSVCQPIAIHDVLEIMLAALDDEGPSVVREIGGPDRLSYRKMMEIYAEVAGLPRRLIVPVPVLTPRLSSHWIRLVTPLPMGVAKPLVDSLRNEVTVSDNTFAETHAGPLTPYREAVERALGRKAEPGMAAPPTRTGLDPAQPGPSDPPWAGGTVFEQEQVTQTRASAEALFDTFSRIGGEFGFPAMGWAWRLRGIVDALFGGVGPRRHRRDPEELRAGDAVDAWRVVEVVPGALVQLHSEMRLPGEAWLCFEATGRRDAATLVQRTVFVPRGLFGRLYWWGMYPLHTIVFERMARSIARAAEARSATADGGSGA